MACNECLGVNQQNSIGKPAPRKAVSTGFCYTKVTRAVSTFVAMYRWETGGCLSPRLHLPVRAPGGEKHVGVKRPKGTIPCLLQAQSVALGRECVLRSRGRKGRGDTSLPSRNISLHTDPGTTQPQTCACTHQTSAQTESPWVGGQALLVVASPCLHTQNHTSAGHSGQKGLCSLLRGRGAPETQNLLLIHTQSSQDGAQQGSPLLLPLQRWESR